MKYEIIKTQPLEPPKGLVFYLDYVYKDGYGSTVQYSVCDGYIFSKEPDLIVE